MDGEYLKKILDKLDMMEMELKSLTSKIDTLDAKDLPARMNSIEKQVGQLQVNQAKVFAGITTFVTVLSVGLKFIK